MKRVVYFAAYDYPFTQMAILAIESLRVYGGYKGDVVVFTNAEAEYLDQLSRHAEIVHHKQNKVDPKAMKFRCPQYFDFKRYDRIMYLDSDMLVLSSLDPLFHMTTDENVVCRIASNGGTMQSNSSCCWRFKDDGEQQKARIRRCMNSGFFSLGNHTFHKLCQRWSKRIDIRSRLNPSSIYDQPAFNCVLARYNYHCDYASRRQVTYEGDKVYRSTILLHFEHDHKLRRMLRFTETLPELESPGLVAQRV